MAAATLITGATGLIGRWTLQHWTGTPPISVGHEHFDLLRAGSAATLLNETRPEAVVHLAWCASGTPGYRDSDDNVRWIEATLDLARECRNRGSALYLTGTVVDDEASAPEDKYTRAKQQLRAALADDITGGTVSWLRPHYVFDPTAGRPALVAQALAARAGNDPVTLAHPDVEHDFVHASDVGSAVAHAVRHRLRGIVEIGSGRVREVRRVVEALGVVWVRASAVTPAPSTLPAQTHPLAATGWTASCTEEFFADV